MACITVKVVLEIKAKAWMKLGKFSVFHLVFPKIFHTRQVSVIILSDATQVVCSKGVPGSDSNKNF